MPVVKADAYGHGAREVARALAGLGAPLLAVAYAEEAATHLPFRADAAATARAHQPTRILSP